MKIINSILATTVLAGSVMALEPMQKEAGFSGHVLLGTGYLEYKNNEVAGNRLVDLENKSINDLGTPSKESQTIPVITGVARYTFEGKQTEIFLGNNLEDHLRMDSSLSLGVRHKFDGLGIIGARFLFSTTPTDVYEDPLEVGTNRSTIERTSSGLGLKWENILGSKFEVDVRMRNIDFDNDKNGLSQLQSGAITNGEYKDLRRKGTMASAELLYTFTLNDSNYLIPSVKFTNNDADGDARTYTQSEAKLSHLFLSTNWLIASSVFVGTSSYDDENPVFNEKQDTDFYGGGVNVTYKQIFGWKDWSLNSGFYVSRGDSDIAFYDSRMFLATVGIVYSF